MRKAIDARSSRLRYFTAIALVATASFVAVAVNSDRKPAASCVRQATIRTSQRDHFLDAFAQLPLTFEPNKGQAEDGVKFVSRRSNFTIFLTSDGATLSMHGAGPALGGIGRSLNPGPALRQIYNEKSEPADNLRIKFMGANPAAKLSGTARLRTVTNYLMGSDPARWHTSIPNYAEVKYESIYPGVDLVFYGSHGRLEYDLDVAAGVDPHIIRMDFDGTHGVKFDRSGDLLLRTGKNQVVLGRPIAYQEADGARRPVAAKYVLKGSSEVAIAVGEYNRQRPLIIDPAIMYSTYIGGTIAQGQGIAVDAAGEAFISGWTCCANNFPTAGAYQGNLHGIDNAFVAKFSADGKSLIYSTYLGGSGINFSTGIAVDSKGHAFVTGVTNSTDFPTMPLHGSTLAGGFDAFVTELNPAGNGLIYSRYLGGSKDDIAAGIAVDPTGIAYVTGQTFSTDFPTTASAYQAGNPSGGTIGEGFLARIDPPTSPGGDSQLFYATYFGGSDPGGKTVLAGDAIGGPVGNVYVVGGGSKGVPVTTGQPFGGTFDAVVADFDTTQSGPSSLSFSEFIGGSGFDSATGVATQLGCKASCSAFVTGYTFSADLNLIGALSTIGGLDDAFVAEVNPHGGLSYINYVGGSSFDEASGAAVDSKGDEIIAGVTFRPPDLPGPFTEVLQPLTTPNGALFTSADSGVSFAPASWPGAKAGSITFQGLVVDKSVTPSIVYAGTDQEGLWQSIDGGVTFAMGAFGGAQVTALGLQTGLGSGPKVVFAAAAGFIWASGNAGGEFVKLGAIPVSGPVNIYFVGGEEPSPAGPANFLVFAGTDHGFFVSTDFGSTFAASTGLTTGSQMTQVFAGVRDTSTGAYYVGTDKGVFKSTDDGTTFVATNLNSSAVLSLAVDVSTTPSTIYAATYGNGVIASTDGFNKNLTFGETAPSSNLNYVALDDTTSNPAIVYVGTGDSLALGSVWRSADAGQTYTQLDAANFNQPCCIFPLAVNNGEILAGNYLEADAFIAKMSTDGAYILASSDLGGTNHDQAQGIAVDTADNAYVDGLTYSTDYPVLVPEQAKLGSGGVVNAFVTKVGYTSKAKIKVTTYIDFKTQILRTPSQPKTVIVMNTSKTDPVALGYIRVSGEFADDFQIISGAHGFATTAPHEMACGTTLAPHSKCSITVEFTPLAVGIAATGLLVSTNASNGTQATLLYGQGKARHP